MLCFISVIFLTILAYRQAGAVRIAVVGNKLKIFIKKMYFSKIDKK